MLRMEDMLPSRTMQKERLLALETLVTLNPYLSISQLCDMGNKVTFYLKNCFVSSLDEDKVIFSGERINNVYVIDLNKIDNKDIKCLMSISHDTWTWHRRLGHANFELMNDFCKNELVIGMPKLKFNKDKPCDAYQKEKQSKSLFKL